MAAAGCRGSAARWPFRRSAARRGAGMLRAALGGAAARAALVGPGLGLGLGLGLVGLMLATGLARADAPQPPHALPALGVDSRQPGDAALDRPFEFPLPARVRSAQGRQRVELRHCRDWLQQRHQVTGSDNDAAWRVLRRQVVPCEALALLLAATVPTASALPADDPRRPLLTARFPASLWPAPSDDEQRRLAVPGQNLARVSGVLHWRKVDDAVHADGEQLALRTRSWRLGLTLLARGDFNHDGWEDAAYLWQADALRGSFSDARLVVLSRTASGEVFHELAVDSLLTAAGWPGEGVPVAAAAAGPAPAASRP